MYKNILLLSCLIFGFHQSCPTIIVETVWDNQVVISDPLLEALIEDDVMQRLHFIDQSGPIRYFGLVPAFNRYEHSVGVLALLQKTGASLSEQAAGLLHDTSHTAFSHLGDHLLGQHNQEKSYQDIVHLEFLHQANVEQLTLPYGITLEQLEPDIYAALEQPLPHLCADRIQYVVHTGVMFNQISIEDARVIINDLSFENGLWFFNSKDVARTFSQLSLHFTKEFWGSSWNFVFYEYFAEILKRALELNIISIKDIKFGRDHEIMTSVQASIDPFICEGLKNLENIYEIFTVTTFEEGDLRVKPKCRAIDPQVKIDGTLKYLSAIDQEYARLLDECRAWCAKGFGVKILVSYKKP